MVAESLACVLTIAFDAQTESGYGIGPVLLGFFVFVLVGSSVIQILRTAQMGL